MNTKFDWAKIIEKNGIRRGEPGEALDRAIIKKTTYTVSVSDSQPVLDHVRELFGSSFKVYQTRETKRYFAHVSSTEVPFAEMAGNDLSTQAIIPLSPDEAANLINVSKSTRQLDLPRTMKVSLPESDMLEIERLTEIRGWSKNYLVGKAISLYSTNLYKADQRIISAYAQLCANNKKAKLAFLLSSGAQILPYLIPGGRVVIRLTGRIATGKTIFLQSLARLVCGDSEVRSTRSKYNSLLINADYSSDSAVSDCLRDFDSGIDVSEGWSPKFGVPLDLNNVFQPGPETSKELYDIVADKACDEIGFISELRMIFEREAIDKRIARFEEVKALYPSKLESITTCLAAAHMVAELAEHLRNDFGWLRNLKYEGGRAFELDFVKELEQDAMDVLAVRKKPKGKLAYSNRRHFHSMVAISETGKSRAVFDDVFGSDASDSNHTPSI